ncbi:unnamed protein product, partial [Ilex paraguariensis]
TSSAMAHGSTQWQHCYPDPLHCYPDPSHSSAMAQRQHTPFTPISAATPAAIKTFSPISSTSAQVPPFPPFFRSAPFHQSHQAQPRCNGGFFFYLLSSLSVEALGL